MKKKTEAESLKMREEQLIERARALHWWREDLCIGDREKFAHKHYPTMSYALVSASSARIQHLYQQEYVPKPENV